VNLSIVFHPLPNRCLTLSFPTGLFTKMSKLDAFLSQNPPVHVPVAEGMEGKAQTGEVLRVG
jgi:hypothetical protein